MPVEASMPPTNSTKQEVTPIVVRRSKGPIEYKYGGGYPFRYETELLGGKVCVPSAKSLEGPSGEALKAF